MLLPHILDALPESTRVVSEDPVDEHRVRSLLSSLKAEVAALERHRAVPPEQRAPELLAEIMRLQMTTDGVTSTITQGWV